MQTAFCPRLSDAKALLPLLRGQLIAAAPRYSLPAAISIELLPIVENGVFGYELVPSRQARSYLTVGFDRNGDAIVRRVLYSADAPGALRLAAKDGELVFQASSDRVNFCQEQDFRFSDISAAVESAYSQLITMFPQSPRRPLNLQLDLHRYLDAALAVAEGYLGKWNPFIHFFGLPLEAEFGFGLRGEHGEHGVLVCRRADMWVLRWKTAHAAIYEEWAVVLSDLEHRGAIEH